MTEPLNPYPFIVAICPTYRRPRLIPNVLAMWEAQTHPADRRHLIILDDGGSFEIQTGQTWELISDSERYPTLGDKFSDLATMAINAGADGIALFEDDDVYLPRYIEAHAATLAAGFDLSQPSEVYSNDKGGKGTRHTVVASGRHHGAWAFTPEIYETAGGYPAQNHGFDFAFQSAVRRAGAKVGDSTKRFGRSYVYRWQTTGYSNGSGWGEDIYDATEKCHEPERVEGRIVPQFDEETAGYYADLAGATT